MASIYKRGKVYWARAERNGRDLRRSLRTNDRRVAESRFSKWLGEIDSLTDEEWPRHTLAEAAQRFIREHLTTLKPGGAQRYIVSLRQIGYHFKDIQLNEITTRRLADFEAARRLDGVAAGTIRRDLACLSSLLTSAEDWEWIELGGNIVPAWSQSSDSVNLGSNPGPPASDIN